MAPNCTGSMSPVSSSEKSCRNFQDGLRTPNHDSGVANSENLDPSQTVNLQHVKSDDKLTSKTDSVSRTPLADVTERFARQRSLSSAPAEIARLGDELEASKGKNKALKDKNRALRGEIVAYQDALQQADEDAGYF